MRPLSGMSHAVGSVRRALRRRRQPSSERPTSATRRRSPCRWSKRQRAPACARLASRMARSAGSSASSGAAASAAISRSRSRSASPTAGGRAAGGADVSGAAFRPPGRRGLRGKIAIARLLQRLCRVEAILLPARRRPDGQKRTPGGTIASQDGGAPNGREELTSGGPMGMVPAFMRSFRASQVLMALACWSLATPARAWDDPVAGLAARARAERAVALNDTSADAHFALFCNLGELMRLDGETLSQVFQLRRLMAEVNRTLELDPNHV